MAQSGEQVAHRSELYGICSQIVATEGCMKLVQIRKKQGTMQLIRKKEGNTDSAPDEHDDDEDDEDEDEVMAISQLATLSLSSLMILVRTKLYHSATLLVTASSTRNTTSSLAFHLRQWSTCKLFRTASN